MSSSSPVEDARNSSDELAQLDSCSIAVVAGCCYRRRWLEVIETEVVALVVVERRWRWFCREVEERKNEKNKKKKKKKIERKLV